MFFAAQKKTVWALQKQKRGTVREKDTSAYVSVRVTQMLLGSLGQIVGVKRPLMAAGVQSRVCVHQ